MSREEEAYAEVLRRIREVENTEASALDLSDVSALERLPGELERLTSLQSLDLSRCGRLSDLAPLARLSSLQRLDLSRCEQLGNISSLVGLTALKELNLSRCEGLSDLRPLAKLTSLERLDLSECFMFRGDLSPLAQLTTLQSLDLSGCWNLTGNLSPLAKLTSLKSLNLSGCLLDAGSSFGAINLSPLAGLTSLEFLALNDWNLYRISPLANLTKLQSLELSNCLFGDDRSTLAQLTSLRSLRFSGSGLYNGDLSLFADLTLLQSLDLSRCNALTGDLSPLAKLTSLQTLNLSKCRHLDGDLVPVAKLVSLQSLNLSQFVQLSDLSPLAGLVSLQTLDLSWCEQLSDLIPLAGLVSLQTLNLAGCSALRQFDPIKELLPSLQALNLFGCMFDDLPSEVCGESDQENVLAKVNAHYEDLKTGRRRDAEVKVLFLGNGGTGKTQLCRRLRGEPFDTSVATTHGIQLSEKTMELEDFPEPVRLNLWDFGGQEVYHGSHALFLQGHAVFLILWTPKLEQGSDSEGDLSFRHRPLTYWLDYLRAFAGVNSSVLLIQSHCDTVNEDAPVPAVAANDFPSLRHFKVSALTKRGPSTLGEALKEAAHDCFERRPPPPIGMGRVAVRRRLREMLAQDQALPLRQRLHRVLERADFDRLCDEEGGVSDKEALLDFLHHSGVIFYQPKLFGGRIVLDQNWALEAIYALFDRKKTLPMLRGYGRFTRADLEALIWSDFTPEEQKVFLSMMESCGICFPARLFPSGEREYIAPELLPAWSDAQEQLLGRLREDPPAAEAEARYGFLHEGILRGYLSKIGQHAKDTPVYWKYGCWFYEKTTKSQVLIESQWDDPKTESGPGKIRFQAWGERANALVQPLLEALQTLAVGRPPEINRSIFARGQVHISASASAAGVPNASGSEHVAPLEQLEISARAELPVKKSPEVFVSYAWRNPFSVDLVEKLCLSLEGEWRIIRDTTGMQRGDLISVFMKRLSRADCVIVVLSNEYLRSRYCMTELYDVYRRSLGVEDEFQRRVIPLLLDNSRINDWEDRLVYAQFWKDQYQKMEPHLSILGGASRRLYDDMYDWHRHIDDILGFLSDRLGPRGFEDIVKENFAALRQMLQRVRSEPRS
jgi:internalin A